MELAQSKTSNKKRRKFSFKFVIIIFVILILYMIYAMYFKETPFLKSESPNKINQVEIMEYGNGLWNGPQKVNIYFKNPAKKILDKEQVKVANTMRRNGQNQYELKWESDQQIKITMKYEHATEIVRYNFSTQEIRRSSALEQNF
ncbi:MULTISPECIES: hypothetical protein [Priestia]|uniref:hypothetical protein n=1 Tax=Priestia TaxID=2800373 RepID=UPI001CFACB6E|nr:hypothetical protein [Priestia aryabhattai]